MLPAKYNVFNIPQSNAPIKRSDRTRRSTRPDRPTPIRTSPARLRVRPDKQRASCS